MCGDWACVIWSSGVFIWQAGSASAAAFPNSSAGKLNTLINCPYSLLGVFILIFLDTQPIFNLFVLSALLYYHLHLFSLYLYVKCHLLNLFTETLMCHPKDG